MSLHHERIQETTSFTAPFRTAKTASFMNQESRLETGTFGGAFRYPERPSFGVCGIFAIGSAFSGPIAKMPRPRNSCFQHSLKAALKIALSATLSLFKKSILPALLKDTETGSFLDPFMISRNYVYL